MRDCNKCVKCDEKATFDSPKCFCNEHWATWYAGLDPDDPLLSDGLSEKELQDWKKEILERINQGLI